MNRRLEFDLTPLQYYHVQTIALSNFTFFYEPDGSNDIVPPLMRLTLQRFDKQHGGLSSDTIIQYYNLTVGTHQS